MNYGAEIAGLMAEWHKLRVAAETHKKERGRDREYRLLHIRQHRIFDREEELRRQAAQEFAALNGWHWTTHQFLARTLARGGTHEGRGDGGGGWGTFGVRDETIDGWMHHVLFDHPLFFREIARPYRTAAIVGQPYNTDIADARANAAKIGLVLHVPPKETASWWYPGSTRFFCFTRPEVVSVQFLPEQMEREEEKS
jgi:hypothetical protein